MPIYVDMLFDGCYFSSFVILGLSVARNRKFKDGSFCLLTYFYNRRQLSTQYSVSRKTFVIQCQTVVHHLLPRIDRIVTKDLKINFTLTVLENKIDRMLIYVEVLPNAHHFSSLVLRYPIQSPTPVCRQYMAIESRVEVVNTKL